MSFGSRAAERFGQGAETAARFQNELLVPILRDKAAAEGSASSAAFSNALGLQTFNRQGAQQDLSNLFGGVGLFSGLEQGERGEMRGERAFTEGLRTQARDQAIEGLMATENRGRGRAQ